VKANTSAFHARLNEGLVALDLSLDEGAVERLHRYFLELKKWSAKVNLIAKGTADDEIVENHFLDSLTLLPLLRDRQVHLLDIGSGAGFPGLVLKAACPAMRLTLVEPRLKRVSFLRLISRTLGLAGVDVLACRIEDEQQLPSITDFSHITSRAVTDVAGFLKMAARFRKPGLKVICMKGPKWQEELETAAEVIGELGYVREKVILHVLPFSSAERTLLVYRTDFGA
jgi:16S rRNA (guanine527-N7)-methyltransferase